MLNFATAQEAATTAANSFNSANREQQIFNQSLEARINRLRTAWSSFATTAGDSILYDGIVVATSALNALSEEGEGVIGNIGLLAPAFGLVGIAVTALSGQFRTLITTTYAQNVATITATGANRAYAVSLGTVFTAANLTTKALKGLGLATGVGIAFAAVGFAVEKVTSAISDNIQAQEKLDQYNQNNIDALTKNAQQVEVLIQSFKDLSAQREANQLDADGEREYLQVQTQLAEVFPGLISYIDSTGQAYLKTGEAIDEQIAKTRELIKVQNEVSIGDSLDAFEDLNNRLNGGRFSFDNFLNGNLQKQANALEESIKTLKELDIDDSKARLQLINIRQEIANTYDQIRGEILNVATSIAELEGVLVDPQLQGEIQKFIQGLDISNLDEDGYNKLALDIGNVVAQLQKAFSEGDSEGFNKLGEALNEIGDRTLKFKPNVNGFKVSIDDLNRTSNLTTIPIDTLGDGIEDLGQDAEGAQDAVKGLTGATEEYKSVAEQLAMVSEDNIDAVNDLIFQYDSLTSLLGGLTDAQINDLLSKQNLTSEEQFLVNVLRQREGVMAALATQYPQLLGQDSQAISLSKQKREAIVQENEANRILLEGYKLARDGKLTAEQNATLASANGTKQRINFIKNEIQALQLLQRQQRAIADSASGVVAVDPNTNKRIDYTAARSTANRISNYEVELSQLQALYNATTATVGGFIQSINSSSSATKGSTSATKSNTEARKENIYVIDQYAKRLAEINLEIERQSKLRENLAESDDRYNLSLRDQLKYEEQKLGLYKQQAQELARQINTGAIRQTGSVASEYDSSAQAIEQARLEFIRLQSDILGQENIITSLYNDVTNSSLAQFANIINKLNREFDLHSAILQNVNRNTAEYNQALQRQQDILQEKIRVNNLELKFLSDQINSGKLSSAVVQELTERYNELSIANRNYQAEFGQIGLDKQGVYRDEQDRQQRLLDYYAALLPTLTEGSNEYTQALNNQRQATRNLIQQQQYELDALEDLATRSEYSGKALEDINARTNQLRISILRLNHELTNADVQASQQALEQIYNQYVKAYKDATNERKDDTLRAIAAERKAETDAYNERVRRLNDELNLFRRNANERLALLDREEAQRSFDEDIDTLENNRNRVQTQVDRLVLDNSREGVARKARLEEELEAIDKEIAERRRDRDLTLQREAIQGTIEAKEEEIDIRLNLEEESYNTIVNNLDRQREYYEQYYNDLLNDERRFAAIREQIVSGNLTSIQNEFNLFIGQLTSTIPEIENTFDGTLKAVGTAIRYNVIDNLREAINLINEYNSSSFRGASVTGNTSVLSGLNSQNLPNGFTLSEAVGITGRIAPIATANNILPQTINTIASTNPISIQFTGDINAANLQQADNFASRVIQGIRDRGGTI